MTSTPVLKNNTIQNKKKRIKPEYRFLIIVISALTLALILSLFVFRLAMVRGDSMKNTFSHNDWLIVSRLAYSNSSPKRGDIVIFERDSLTDGQVIKRIIALPDETVEIKNGIVFINDKPLDDEFSVFDENDNLPKTVVESDSYFVLGDNRKYSNDSRHWDTPFLKKEEIRGKVILRIFPQISKPNHSI